MRPGAAYPSGLSATPAHGAALAAPCTVVLPDSPLATASCAGSSALKRPDLPSNVPELVSLVLSENGLEARLHVVVERFSTFTARLDMLPSGGGFDLPCHELGAKLGCGRLVA
jgi:hypothetical protein